MRKKYLSALLFGALLFASAGTFTSCKDYDDDINNLQEQIDAQKSLAEKLTAVESSINDLKAADADLQSKIDAATEAAEKAALEAQQNAVKEAAAQLETVKGELTAMISEQKEATDESIEAINTEIAKIQGSVQALEKLNGEIESLKTVDAALQTSISGLETKVAENARKIGELQTTLEAQEDALELFKAATGENVEALQGDIAVLQAKVAELAGSEDLRLVSEQLAALQDDFEALSDKVDAISADLNLLKNAWYTGVTSVSLYPNSNGLIINGQQLAADDANIILFSAKSIADRTFGVDELAGIKLFDQEIQNPYTVKKGERSKLKSTVLVRVSPVTATLSDESIKFVDSFGEERLNGLVSVKVRKYGDNKNDEILTRGAQVSASGLWVVELEATGSGEDFETKFDEATLVEKESNDKKPGVNDDASSNLKSVLFAMKIVDSQDGSSRGVVSEYDLAFGKAESQAQDNIDFDVFVGSNRYNVTRLHNRAIQSEETAVKAPAELYWTGDPAAEVITEGGLQNVSEVVDPETATINQNEPQATDVKANDNRQGLQLDKKNLTAGRYVKNPVVQSDENSFTIRVNNTSATHYYVVLDKERSVSSDNSEITAWNVYEQYIDGINKVYDVQADGREVTISFNKKDINDVIGFRVFVLNSNGTLVDPDGRAFYVRVGEVANVATATTSIIPDANVLGKKSLEVPFEQLAQFADNKTVIASSAVVCDKVYDANNNEVTGNIFDFKFALEGAKEGEYKDLSYFNNKKVEDLAKIKSVYVTKTVNGEWKNLTDGKTYKNTISFKNDKGVVIATLEVNVTKTMPTSLPEGFGWKETQLADGNTYNCYVLADKWGADEATEANMGVDKVFNVDDEVSNPAQYLFTFRTNDPKNDKKVVGYVNQKISLDKSNFDMIDCKTEYAAVIEYNYGAISSKTDQDIKVSNLTAAEPQEYKLIYHNLFAEDHYTINWATAEQLAADGIYKTKRYVKTSIADQAAKVVFGKEFKAFEAYEDDKCTKLQPLDLFDAVVAASSIDNTYNKFIGASNNYIAVALDGSNVKEAKFITKSTNQVSEYFEVSFTNDSNARTMYLKPLQNATDGSPITGSIPSILRVKLVDSFGFERVIELPMTVVPNL